MPLYAKSKQLIRRSWRRIADSIRYTFGRIYTYHVPLSFIQKTHNLRFKSDYAVTDIPLFEQAVLIRSETFSASIAKVDISFIPEIHIETPPQEIEAEIITEPTALAIPESKKAVVKEFNTSITSASVDFTVKRTIKKVTLKPYSAAVKGAAIRPVETASRDGIHILDALPFLRTSLSVFSMDAESRVGYWKELISQVKKQPKELELLGIFPNVPTKGITKASIDPANGQLKLWCNRDSRKGGSATLLIAKDRESGHIYRVYDRRTLST